MSLERITRVDPIYSAVTRGAGHLSTLRGLNLTFVLTNFEQAVELMCTQTREIWVGRPRDYLQEVGCQTTLFFLSREANPAWTTLLTSTPWLRGAPHYSSMADNLIAMEYHLTLLEYGSDALWEKLEETHARAFGGAMKILDTERPYRRVLDVRR